MHTYAWYNEQPAPELTNKDRNCWTLCLQIPIPSTDQLLNPTLVSLVYTIKYATTWDNGNSTVQADTILTTVPCPHGVVTESTDLGIYRNKLGYRAQMVDEEKAVCLSTVPAIKCNGGSSQWSHYIDYQRLTPNVRITHPGNLYLTFHVVEYPTAHTLRCLAVDVSAGWLDYNPNPPPPPPPPDTNQGYNPALDAPRPSKIESYLRQVFYRVDAIYHLFTWQAQAL